MENKEGIIINVRLGLIGEELELRENINIEVENGIIQHIGNGFSSEGITFKNGIVLPTLVNSHVHSADFICQEMGYNKPIKEVVGDPNSIKYKCLSNHSEKEIKNSIIKFAQRAKDFGSHVILDFREQGLIGSKIANQAKSELKRQGVLYYILGRLENNEINNGNLKVLHEIVDGYGLSSTSDINPLIKDVFKDKIRAIHISETLRQWLRNDLESAIKEYNPNLIIHGTHLSEEEMEILKERKISLVICPRSNLWFSVGVPKVVNSLRAEINVLLGTDNGGVLDPNLWKEMETFLLLTRLQDPLSDYSLHVLKAVTTNAYRFLGINGWIEEGNIASLMVVEGEKSGILTSNNKYMGIIKRGNKIIYALGAIQNVI
ncbi:N-ethylammeline chlorohydrolase [Sulfolobus sp. A20]|uniref:amidohydrolase family protein n=1 Tax=Sulfolobaceae TaxID=118883 RepID=UPI000845D181|nr:MULTISPECIES: amidohydrolase family protein [unclassified Sulfolobus]TRM77581.1 N-ethylammeline chlorohydrolase [Sulfolobus sp. A20-N-F8]TRM81876.1 N-ethylammeline chlorohydrolase [Sulfolobus sp. D5]TRM83344.1 N-ethylammeline chlorohydrolase [Sulfolobus sp. A20-N-F6]TRM85092.1 N-ethylammeline chlorohydrolase [Sulfolobus sp. F3]TRM88901.1 N-ethylammeline chlorohydrolase [Sulfolobus sp. E3]TRM89892.1 N-ethylammeline chlorohydrolase [Sulfolobus sp. C3]TRN01545.1 N-ethylammeline chlorohydrola